MYQKGQEVCERCGGNDISPLYHVGAVSHQERMLFPKNAKFIFHVCEDCGWINGMEIQNKDQIFKKTEAAKEI